VDIPQQYFQHNAIIKGQVSIDHNNGLYLNTVLITLDAHSHAPFIVPLYARSQN